MKSRSLAAAAVSLALVGAGALVAWHPVTKHHDGQLSSAAISPVAATSASTAVEKTYPVGHGNNVYAYVHTHEHNVPWVIKVHGGSWETGSGHRADMVSWARHEQARGYAAFTVDYRLVPSVHWPTPVEDVEHAVTWIRAHASTWGLDLNRGFMIGSSAGGLLASVTALRLGGFLGVITLAGAVDPYQEYLHDPDPNLRKAAFELNDRTSPTKDPALWQDSSAAHYLGRYRMPFLLIHSVHDPIVSVASSRDFYAELKAAAYPATLDLVGGDAHPPTGNAVLATQDAWMASLVRASIAKKVLANK
jgi:acetyl esterase/lipase